MKPADQGLIGADGDAEVQAANDDHGPMHGAHESASATTATGWDAFEVWRSRVRDPRRAASRTFPE